MDDFLFLADSYDAALLLRQRRIDAMLAQLGLQRNPKKGVWTPTYRRPLGPSVRPQPRNVPRPTRLTTPTSTTSVLPLRPGCLKRSMATRAPTCSFREESLVPLHGHRTRALFFLRELHNVLATRSGPGGGVARPPNASATSRPRVVAHGSHPKQRPVHLQAYRDRLPPPRLQQLRIGSRTTKHAVLGTAPHP
jgi:hypothetical protein